MHRIPYHESGPGLLRPRPEAAHALGRQSLAGPQGVHTSEERRPRRAANDPASFKIFTDAADGCRRSCSFCYLALSLASLSTSLRALPLVSSLSIFAGRLRASPLLSRPVPLATRAAVGRCVMCALRLFRVCPGLLCVYCT